MRFPNQAAFPAWFGRPVSYRMRACAPLFVDCLLRLIPGHQQLVLR